MPRELLRAILAATLLTSTEGAALFTPQQLFGEALPPANVLTHAPFLERARAEHERERDVSARLALGAYLVARLIDRLLQPESAESRDGFLWQLDAVRRHLRDLPSDSPESAHLHGIVDAVPAGPQSPASLRLGLMAYAYFLEHEGRLEEALEILGLAVRTHGGDVPAGDFAASALFAGRLNRLLARWNEATNCYLSAESAADRAGDRVLALRACLGRANVFRGQGNLPLARASVEAVIEAARAAELRDVQAMALTDLGAVCSLEGRRVEMIQSDTSNAVSAISEISQIIGRINDFQLTIASAVEEQTATTNEMARNVAEASTGSGEIATNISGVATAADTTTTAVSQTLAAIAELSQMSQDLRAEVGRFTIA